MRIVECWFCGGPVYPGHGITFVRNDAKIMPFCRSKCRKNYKLRRNPRRVRWTKAYRRTHGKEMIIDSTLEFAKKRNRPLKYNRERMQHVLRAIKRVHAINSRRERVFYETRMRKNRVHELMSARRDLKQNISLLQAPSATRAKIPIKANMNEEQVSKSVHFTLLRTKEKPANMQY